MGFYLNTVAAHQKVTAFNTETLTSFARKLLCKLRLLTQQIIAVLKWVVSVMVLELEIWRS